MKFLYKKCRAEIIFNTGKNIIDDLRLIYLFIIIKLFFSSYYYFYIEF